MEKDRGREWGWGAHWLDGSGYTFGPSIFPAAKILKFQRFSAETSQKSHVRKIPVKPTKAAETLNCLPSPKRLTSCTLSYTDYYVDTETPKISEEQEVPKRGRGRPRLYPPGDPRYAERRLARGRERSRGEYGQEYRRTRREQARARSSEWREKNREYHRERSREFHREYKRTQAGQAARMIHASRTRAKKSGLEHTITAADLELPTHCPVLGIELNYQGGEGTNKNNSASLDRHDNSLGYIPGNVRVISNRANKLKNNGTPDELMAVARYAKYGAAPPALADIW